ncbi:MAG: radical SAM protein [Phaeospirillum sp.]|nr:radical SAM protein [Phaeospirillum sp.]
MLSNRCNLRCEYCCIPSREGKELSTERCLSILDEMAAAGTTRVGLLGGEPLIRSDIHEIVTHAKRLGMMVQLYSNGYYVPKKLETIKLLDGLFISVDGPEDVHDLARGKGSYAAAMAAIQAARPHVPVFMISVVTNRSRRHLGYMAELARANDCLVTFQTVTKLGDLSPDVTCLELNDQELDEVFLELRMLRRENPHVVTSEAFIEKVLNRRPDQPRDHYQMGSIKCWYGKALANIDADGTVYTCSSLIGIEQGLNLRDSTFRQAWDHIGSTRCQGCNITCGGEYNVFLSLNPSAVKNVVRILWRVLRS